MPRARWISLTQSVGIPYSQLTVGVLKETFPLERRVVQSPESVKLLTKAGLSVRVQAGAGEAAIFSDADYEAAGATIVPTAEEVWRSDIVLKIRAPSSQELTLLGDRTLISMLNPAKNEELLEQLQKQKATAFSLDCIPRMLSRGQTFDVLSSQTNIAGESLLSPTAPPLLPKPPRNRILSTNLALTLPLTYPFPNPTSKPFTLSPNPTLMLTFSCRDRRVPRGGGGGQRVRPLLLGSDDGGWQGVARQGAGTGGGRGGACGHPNGEEHGGDSEGV